MSARLLMSLPAGTPKDFVLVPGGQMDLASLDTVFPKVPTFHPNGIHPTLAGILGQVADFFGLINF